MIEIEIKKYRIFILDTVLEIMAKYKQDNSKSPEAGGILLGQVRDNSIYVMKASVPTVYDKATRTSFQRNRDYAQIIIDYEFENSSKKTIYMGEWHTHPDKYPKPSDVDRKMILDQYSENQLNEPFLILAIQGTDELFIGLVNKKGLKGVNINQ
jgi:integrative and conjugative element protein (TIGR02256 family)